MAINPVQLVGQNRQMPDFVGDFMRGRAEKRAAENQNQIMDMRQQQMAAQQQAAEAERQAALEQQVTQFFGRAGDILANVPAEQQPAVYNQIKAYAKANMRPTDIEGMPEQFSPELVPAIQREARLKGYMPPERKTAKLSEGESLLDTQTGETIASIEEKPDQKDVTGQVNTLRSTINSNLADFRKVEDSFKRIQNVAKNPSAAGDLALIFNYMKLLDPGSVVRESEFATAQNAAGVPERVRNSYNRVLSGERLGPDQRADFVGQADNLFTAQREQADKQISNVLEQADQDGIPRSRVLGADRLKAFEERLSGRQSVEQPQQPDRDRAQAKLMRDANGNQAYVYPDGTIEEL